MPKRTRVSYSRPALIPNPGRRRIHNYETYYIPDDEGCWIFAGSISQTGYGNIHNEGAHRWFYKYYVGPIPDGMTIDHLCRKRDCVNPDHLEVVTIGENNRRRPFAFASRTHCKNGHEVNNTNTYIYASPRGSNDYRCRVCARERMRARRAAS